MPDYYKIVRPIFFALPPETAHNLSVFFLSKGLIDRQEKYSHEKLKSKHFGLNFKNPVGLAAGFDKDGACISALATQNFGFVEVGTVTPLPQKGNKKPRVFRFPKHYAVVNRMGFNNNGVEIFSQRLRQWKYSGFSDSDVVIGANVGRNKDSENNADDYLTCFEKVYGLCDYITINISSPNTPNLRDLQAPENLSLLIEALQNKRDEISTKYKGHVPFLIKISPDESEKTLESIAKVCLEKKVEGVIISNTSAKIKIGEDEAFAENRPVGGLSGAPLFKKSNETIRKFYRFTDGKIPIIGVGGIMCAEDAYKKIKCGASLIQAYTGFIYRGFGLVNEINKGLVTLLEKDGYKNISEAVGAAVREKDAEGYKDKKPKKTKK